MRADWTPSASRGVAYVCEVFGPRETFFTRPDPAFMQMSASAGDAHQTASTHTQPWRDNAGEAGARPWRVLE